MKAPGGRRPLDESGSHAPKIERVARHADAERQQEAEQAARIALVEPVAEHAEEAEARALQDEAEHRAEHDRQRELRRPAPLP